ncbi:MAG: hypothetical protein WEB06_11315 [Actinomycetota bacterium]
MIRRGIAVAVIALSMVAVAAMPAAADHSWNGYHWAGVGDRSPAVVDKTAGGDPLGRFEVPAAVDEWAALNTPMQPVSASSGPVEVLAKRGSAQWIGLAQIQVSGSHITSGRVTLNTLYYNSYNAAEWDYVVCQELGHIWGLGHVDEDFNNPDQGTCMDYTDNMAQNAAPNQHDAQELNAIYAHDDGGSGGGGGSGGPNCDKNPNKPPCQGARDGQWITVHVFWAR